MLTKLSSRLPTLRTTDRVGRLEETYPKVQSLADVEESKQSNLTDVASKTANKLNLVPVAQRIKYRWWIESPMSLICYGLNISCIWTLPAASMANGGIIFLVLYSLLTILFGVSYYVMQLALGQYSSQSAISVWHCVPLAKGIGVATVVTTIIIAFYYSIVMAWALEYLLFSFSEPTPWGTCNDAESSSQHWAASTCLVLERTCTSTSSCNSAGFQPVVFNNYSFGMKTPFTQSFLPAEEYFQNELLEISSGIDQGDGIVLRNFLAYVAVMIIISLLCIRGTRTLGKACVVLCPLTILLGVAVLIRACIEPGAGYGLLLYVQPNWESLSRVQTWGEAGVAAFFTVLPSWAAVTTIGSYNRFDYNLHRHAFVSVFVVLFCSLIFGLMGAAFTGILTRVASSNNDASLFIGDGASMVFVIAAQALSILGQPWSILFYLFMVLLTVTTLCWMTETIVLAIIDIVPKNRRITSFITRKVLIAVLLLLGLAGTSRAGYYVMVLVESYTWKMTVMVYALAEVILVSWVYGAENLLAIIHQMNGSRQVRLIWFPLWKGITPLLVLLFLVYTWCTAIDLNNWQFAQPYGVYIFPDWTKAVGYLIMLGPLLLIPLFAIIPLFKKSGHSLKEGLQARLKPDAKWHPEGQIAEEREASTVIDGADLPMEGMGKWTQSGRLQVDSVTQPELTQITEESKLPPLNVPKARNALNAPNGLHVPNAQNVQNAPNVDDRDAGKSEEKESNPDNLFNHPRVVSDNGNVAVGGEGEAEEDPEKSKNRKKRYNRNRKDKESDQDPNQPDILPPINRRVLRIHSPEDKTVVPPPLEGESRKPFKLPALTEVLLDRHVSNLPRLPPI